jgi:hypothetical protein
MKIRSAMGKVIDVTALMRENEDVLAVSNVKMNARGDRLGPDGKVITSVQQITKKQKSEVSPIITTSIENASMPAKAMAEEEKKIATKKTKKAEGKVVNIVSKTDDAGNTFSEIEYEDGSIEIKQDGEF